MAFVANAAFAQDAPPPSPWTFNAELRAFAQYGEQQFIAGLDNWPRVWVGFNFSQHASMHAQFRFGAGDAGFAGLVHEAFFRVNVLSLLGVDAANLTFRVGLIDSSATTYAVGNILRTEYNERDYFSRAADNGIRRMSIEALLNFAALPQLSIRWISDLDMSADRNDWANNPGVHGGTNTTGGGSGQARNWGNVGWRGLGEVNLNNLNLDAVNLWANAYAEVRMVGFPAPGANVANIGGGLTGAQGTSLGGQQDLQFFGGSVRVGINNLPVILDVGGAFEFVRALEVGPIGGGEVGHISDAVSGFSFMAGVRVGIANTFNLAINYSGIMSDEDDGYWLNNSFDRHGASGVVGLNFSWLGFGFMRPFVGVGAIVLFADSDDNDNIEWVDTDLGAIDRLSWVLGLDIPVPTNVGSLNFFAGWQRGAGVRAERDTGFSSFTSTSSGLGAFYIALRARV